MMAGNPSGFDLFIIGGGINGCGIARDAAGRGLSVGLAEMDDLASGTSSASTKLIHGGLRYLEYFEFRLVRESLREREVLLRMSPHIARPMRFVLPCKNDLHFAGSTPASRLLGAVMPWTRHRRPDWVIRLGLFLYDHLGGRKFLPGTRTLDLSRDPAGEPLKAGFLKAYEYSDCWVEDARLVVLNARDAAGRGAEIMSRTRVVSVRRDGEFWQIGLESSDRQWQVQARMLVNASGPWVGEINREMLGSDSCKTVRLVRGSHIVTRRLYAHDRCYFFQGSDGRIIFLIPFEDDFTLIGTTEEEHSTPENPPTCTEEETRYLLDFVSRYLSRPVTSDDIVWNYSGLRPLYDDGTRSATAATRDYVLKTDDTGGVPLLTVIGGKISTYRKLAEAALDEIAPKLGNTTGPWTADMPLPGGDFSVDGAAALVDDLRRDYGFLDAYWARRLVRTYGTDARRILGQAQGAGDLGQDFGATITAAELLWAVQREWVQRAEDFLWRRTRLGLRLQEQEFEKIDAFIRAARAAPPGKSPVLQSE